MKNLFILSSMLLLSFSSFGKGFGGRDTVYSLKCQMHGPTGKTEISYRLNANFKISTVRNSVPTDPYTLDYASLNPNNRSESHITLSGGSYLKRGSYLILAFDEAFELGKYENIDGQIIYATTGGSVFSPTTYSSSVIGTVHCDEIIIRN